MNKDVEGVALAISVDEHDSVRTDLYSCPLGYLLLSKYIYMSMACNAYVGSLMGHQ